MGRLSFLKYTFQAARICPGNPWPDKSGIHTSCNFSLTLPLLPPSSSSHSAGLLLYTSLCTAISAPVCLRLECLSLPHVSYSTSPCPLSHSYSRTCQYPPTSMAYHPSSSDVKQGIPLKCHCRLPHTPSISTRHRTGTQRTLIPCDWGAMQHRVIGPRRQILVSLVEP